MRAATDRAPAAATQRSGVEFQAAAGGSYTQTIAWGFTLYSPLRSALAHEYGEVFFGRNESPPFDPSRRRENTAPHQGKRIRKGIYEMLHLDAASFSATRRGADRAGP